MPIILGGCALVAIIVTLIVVTGGFSSGYGLSITSAYGSVSVTSSDVSVDASGGDTLKKGDIVTIGDGSSCTIAYKGKGNSDDNYLVLGANTQIVITDAFKGKGDSEIFLRKGTIIGNFAAEDTANIIVRTTDSTITLGQAVCKISYSTNEFTSYTELYTFMGYNRIQLYDDMGNPVNDPEYQAETLWGRIVSESDMSSDTTGADGEVSDGPSFDLLNNSFALNELTAFDLKQLLTIAALVGDGFPYNTADLKAAYEEVGGDSASAENTEPELPEETTVTTEDNSDSIQTAEPIETTPPPTATTLPGQTTTAAYVPTQAPATTTAPPETQTTANPDVSPDTVHIVVIVIDGEETMQEVLHGDDAVKPEDPVIDGLTFIGWDGSFENITQDTVITALFSDSLGGDTTTETTTTTFEPFVSDDVEMHTVTFIVNGESYHATVANGGTVVPPITPSVNQGFIGWDKPLENITSDTVITAIFAERPTHTVTFAIDGQYYYADVKEGDTAVPPFTPDFDSFGNRFAGWDRSLDNITGDIIITAMYSGN
ncbi:MAG: hypothetical protein J1F11_02400 [Oscillospiraceae bacterium]|nr:hypothetical protein [Oscillospiraceae bacterium]